MSQPNSATLRYSSSSQPPVKTLTNSLKTTQEKPVLQLNKFELKSLSDTIGLYSEKSSARQQDSQAYSSQTPQNQQVYSHQHYSPTNSARKAPINPLTKSKAIHEKKSSLKLSLETLDFKDAISGSKKAYPTTSKATKTTYSTNPVEKLKNSTKKSVSISKDEKVKSFLSTYETLFDRKSPTNKDANNKIKSSLDQKELRNNFMEEPPKKSSLPNNLALALHNIYATAGSNSHRTSMNTGPTEPTQAIANNNEIQQQTYGQPRTHKKSYEGEQTAQIITNSSNVVPQVQLQTHQGPGKYSFTGADSVKNVSKISSMKNSQVVAEEKKGNLKDSLDFTNMMKEKNDEIQKLMKDKNELKATVEILITQINDMKRTKSNASGEKDETAENLTQSVVEILGSTNESKETYKENKSQSARQLQKQLQNAKKINNNNYMSKDMESVKILVDQLKHMTDDSEKVINKALEQKNTLIETLTKENLRKSKRSNFNSFEKKDSKKPQSQLSNFNPYQRSSSMTGEELMGKKVQGSPYYDPLKATKKSSKDSASTLAAKKPTSAGLSSSTHSNNRGKEGSKGELYIDTAGGLETVSSLLRTQPNTTTNSDLEMLRRKFSHDPKLISEFISEMFEKRSLGEGMEEHYYENGKGKANGGQDGRVDIGSALNELKGRISGLLGRYKSERIANKQQK